jgi:CubicO group peptidase (beta-lactamase class C family)
MTDFSGVDAALRRRVEREDLAGVSYAVLRGDEVLARNCIGWADREAQVPMRGDHLFRAFSNTKLVTSIAALQLLEQGRFQPDDPIGDYIHALANLRVLRAGATSLDDTEPAREPIRIRHLLTHTSGLTYWFLEPHHPISKAYLAAGIASSKLTLAQQMDALGTLPLIFQPGTNWAYSVATDVVGRLVEVLSGQAIDEYFRQHIFEPLGMHDTFFAVPPDKADRLAALYVGDLAAPTRPGLKRAEDMLGPDAFLKPVPRLNPGGGLVTSLDDYTALLRAMLSEGGKVLRAQTMPLVFENQLPPGMWIGLPPVGPVPGRGHSFAGSVGVHPWPADPARRVGELQWSGLAGTQWWISRRDNVACALMTQRYFGSSLPYWPEFKIGVQQALGLRDDA